MDRTIVRTFDGVGPCEHGRERGMVKVCLPCYQAFQELLNNQDAKIKELGERLDISNHIIGKQELELDSLRKEREDGYGPDEFVTT